jgi:glutaredoxin
VTFYTKAGCHLCEDAREMLDEIAATIPYDLTELDIRSDMTLFAQYRYRIPVIIVNETTTVEGRIQYSNLANALRSV